MSDVKNARRGVEMGAGRDEAKKPVIRMSVRAVVETTLHASDIVPASGTMRRMREGTAAHRARQGEGGRLIADYRAETALSADYEAETLILHVIGRADAIYTDDMGRTVIEEIKLGMEGCALHEAHMAQAAFYGHMLCAREGMDGLVLRVLYVDAQGRQAAVYEQEETADALRARFDALCREAAKVEALRLARRQARDASLAQLAFPFDAYREGQRKFAANVFVAVRERRRLYAQAPTGIGKTMAALYPALLALGEGHAGRVLFLTARTTGRASAMDAMARLSACGARALSLEITAKDKVCPREIRDCRAEVCPLAEGFYDRLPAALSEAVSLAAGEGGLCLTREGIEALAAKHRLCPFELSLELAFLADVIVCDYNYAYDPFVALDRLLAAPGGTALLVDEAHQLAPRVRDAYSAQVSLDALTELRREVGRAQSRKHRLYGTLSAAIGALRALSKKEAFASGRLDEPPRAIAATMEAVLDAAGDCLAEGGSGPALDAFSLAMKVTFAVQHAGERYAILTGGGERHAYVDILCLNAAPEIHNVSRRARGTVYFSATLAPFDAAKRMLGSEEGDACLALASPFDPAQLAARIAPIDLRYANRENAAPHVASEILSQIGAHPGRTIAFFPSYAYMSRVHELLLGMEGTMAVRLLAEERGMREEEKNALLGAFTDGESENTLMLAVLGGSFAEGIDLPGDALTGVIVVSTGLPQPDERVRAMQQYYDGIGEDGFFLCMTLPGMIRVIQAAGRLIRTKDDRGALLLMDSRYHAPRVRALLAGTLIGDALGIQG